MQFPVLPEHWYDSGTSHRCLFILIHDTDEFEIDSITIIFHSTTSRMGVKGNTNNTMTL